jgi:hypothetical protein
MLGKNLSDKLLFYKGHQHIETHFSLDFFQKPDIFSITFKVGFRLGKLVIKNKLMKI